MCSQFPIRFLFVALLCGIVLNVCAGDEMSAYTQSVRDAVGKGDATTVMSMVDKLEEGFGTGGSTEYFQKISIVCQSLAESAHCGNAMYPVLVRCADLLLEKETVNGPLRSALIQSQFDAIQPLLRELAATTSGRDRAWEENRAHLMRLVSIFSKRVRSRLIENFKPFPVSINVAPPEGGGDSGSDPASIKDPVVRAAYVKLIHENSENTLVNQEQRYLSDLARDGFSRIEDGIVPLYSSAPPPYDELYQFLQLGQFTQTQRIKIIRGVERASNTQAPVAIQKILKTEP